jgi:4-oxalocrotonate tautomerase
MPMINLKITKGESTAAQKAQVIEEMTDVLRRVMGKNPDTTIVIIDEVETDNWGIGGQTVTQRRKAEAS